MEVKAKQEKEKCTIMNLMNLDSPNVMHLL